MPSLRKDAKYLALSLVIHSLCLIYLVGIPGCGKGKGGGSAQFGQSNSESSPQSKILPKFEKIEVSLIRPTEKDPQAKQTRQRIERRVHGKDGYWGIGVYMSIFMDEIVFYGGAMYSGMRIINPIQGNPAAVAGLQAGDVIFLIDNMPISVKNEVRGDGPRSMFLHVKRGNSVFTLSIERGWIETSKGHTP